MVQVSVVMAAFNNAETIEESVRSVFAQTFDEWELLIVDDGSADSTLKIAQGLSSLDDRVRVLEMPSNGGSAAARNRAIANAEGQYVAVLDADDICMPLRLEKQVDALQADNDLAATASQLAEFGTWGGPEVARWPVDIRQIQHRQSTYQMPLPHPSAMFRIEILRAVGGYDETCRRAQDYALFLKLRDQKVNCLPDVLVHYRTERPISLGYVQRNARYADLALRRHRLAESGVESSALPNEAVRHWKTELGALKSWVVRSSRERGIVK